MATNW